MPLAGRPTPPPTFLESIVPLLDAPFHPVGVGIVEIVTLPGQVVVSLLLILAAAWRTRRPTWPVAWLLAVAVEVAFRHVLSRPALYRNGVHVVGFDASWPSGHALRCSLVAVALAAAWPRLRVPLGIWLGAAVVLLVLAGFHTPTDVAGGLLLGVVAAAGAVELEPSGLLRRRAALRRRGTPPRG
jgi:membrane-associated phospholipid phosphatase